MRERGALGIAADASRLDSLGERDRAGPHRARPAHLIVNAVAASRPPDDGKGFGGGAVGDATLEGFHGWAVAVAEQAFVFLSTGIRTLRESGGGGTLIQVTGGSARRAMPGRGLWSAGAQATRALTHAAAQEVREEGIHVALLIVDATIESPKTEAFTRDTPREALADMRLIAEAVEYLAGQEPRAVHPRADAHARRRQVGALRRARPRAFARATPSGARPRRARACAGARRPA